MKQRRYLRQWIVSMLVLLVIIGCASKIPHLLAPDYAKRGTRLIAVMPVKNSSADTNVGQIARETVIRELYFKGYPKIPPDVIDEKLSVIYGTTTDFKDGNVPPKSIGALLGVNAVLYGSLIRCKTSYTLLYSATEISMTFELRSVKTGETLWSTRYDKVKRNVGFSKKQLEMASQQVYEAAIQEVVDKALNTLPDGPDG
ncbi:MAG: GNA1162 family protein [Deltaproteobacteria bacterium]|jgi:hypothetical protein